MSMLTEMQKFFDSEEGNLKLLKWANELKNRYTMSNSQLERFHLKYGNTLKDVITKIKSKYNSESYKDKWYKKHIEPPEPLYWFLFNYAEKYGTEASEEEYREYGNMFTSEMYLINDFYISKMNGQGSIIKICKK